MTLLRRGPDGIQLTEAGRQLHQYALRIVHLAKFAEQMVMNTDELPAPLMVGAAECLTAYRLLPLIEYLQLRYPELKTTFRSLDEDPWSMVRDGRIDCALFIDSRSTNTDVNSTLLSSEPLALVADRQHRLAATANITLSDLAAETMICAHHASTYQVAFEQLLVNAGADLPRTLAVGSIIAVKRGLAEGIGVALLPRITVAQELCTGQLIQLGWHPPFEFFSQIAWRPELDSDSAFRTLLLAAKRVTAEQSSA